MFITAIQPDGGFCLSKKQVIARRAKPDAAISWYCVRNCTLYQEIAAPSARNDTVEIGWSFWIYNLTSTGSRTSMLSTSTAQSIAMTCTPLAAASRSARPNSGSVSSWGRMYLTSDIWMTKRM